MTDWTIMIYMAGDNNLSENMALALEDLELSRQDICTAGKQGRVNLLAYFDGNSLTAPTHYIDFSGEETLRHPMQPEDRVYPVQKPDTSFGQEDDSASAYSILNFVHWCLETRQRTASNYALIFSAHSFGFHGTSFLRDETSGSFMTLFKFRWALEEINRRYLKDGKKLAILGFDSCVMSMLEVGYELKDVARTMVASEGSLPNSGWGYGPMIKTLVSSIDQAENLSQTPEEYVKNTARGFVKAFIGQYKNLAIGGRSVDLASWELTKIEPVAIAVNDLARELNRHLDITDKINEDRLTGQDVAIYQELKKIILQSHFDAQTYMKEQCVDLKDFCQRLIIECSFLENGENGRIFTSIIEKCKAILPAVDDCVLKCGYSGEEYQFSNGISLYFPWTYVTYFLTDYRYRWLLFNRGFTADGRPNEDLENPTGIGKDWDRFLRNYVARVTLRERRKNGEGKLSPLNNFANNGAVLSKDNPVWSKDNPIWSKDNPIWSKDNPIWSKGEIGEYLFHFGRFKNFQLSWDINGYADEVELDEKLE